MVHERHIRGSDFSDEEINSFFDSVERLTWTTVERVPEWVARQADAFAASKPRPSPEELRMHVDHAVAVSRGWDHPNDRGLMFASAIKSFYMLAWLDHLQQHTSSQQPPVDMSMGLKAVFTPVTPKQLRSDVETEQDRFPKS